MFPWLLKTPKFLAIIGRVFTNQSTNWHLRKASRAVIHPFLKKLPNWDERLVLVSVATQFSCTNANQ
jgi:hypothetical protein